MFKFIMGPGHGAPYVWQPLDTAFALSDTFKRAPHRHTATPARGGPGDRWHPPLDRGHAAWPHPLKISCKKTHGPQGGPGDRWHPGPAWGSLASPPGPPRFSRRIRILDPHAGPKSSQDPIMNHFGTTKKRVYCFSSILKIKNTPMGPIRKRTL